MFHFERGNTLSIRERISCQNYVCSSDSTIVEKNAMVPTTYFITERADILVMKEMSEVEVTWVLFQYIIEK